MKKNKINFVKFCLLFLNIFCFGQELPPITKYSPDTYKAGNQNWMISQDKNYFVYFANNEGLLEFNGSNWNLYKSPNETIIRSVKVIEDKIYTGCYMEFGYWTRQPNGLLKYTSLSDRIKPKIQDDEHFWNIISYDQWIVFQSLSKIYIYDTKSKKFNIISPKNNIIKSFRTTNAIYFQVNNEGLFEIENGQSKLISDHSIIKNNKITNVFFVNDALIIQTQNIGMYKLVDNNLTKFVTDVDIELSNSRVYSSQILSDGSYAIGTISSGIFIIESNGKLKYHITQNRGLSNNTALSLFEDVDKNLWIGLDNGINCINLQSPIKSFSDDTGILGTVYASILHNGNLYIGSNQGLFYKKFDNDEQLKFIPGTKGQVWSLFELDGALFCGHDSGTFVIENSIALNIYNKSGTWKFVNVPNKKNILLQGNYNGISVLEKVGSQWVFKNKIAGFDYSSKYFELLPNNEIFVSHEYKGVFRLKVDNQFLIANKINTDSAPKKGKNAGLTRFNNRIYYSYIDGIFKLNPKTEKFEKDKTLSVVFENDEYTSGKMIVDKSNRIWLFTKNYIHYFSMSKLSSELKQNKIPIPSSLNNSMLGYENVTQLSNNRYLIGTTDGYYIININDLTFKNYNISISNINVNKLNAANENCSIFENGLFNYDKNNITFNFTVPEFDKYINTEYQYKLEGFQNDWSDWNTKSTINFKNLSPGNYVFKVKARIANSSPENIATYVFRIEKPWFATNLALIVYLFLLLILAYFINKTYKSYYKKQQEKLIEENNMLLEINELENEQQLMKLRNEKLSQDFDEKNRELAVSKMSLIQKNELLAVIKEDLKNTADDGNRNVKSVITTINKNINESDSWKVFKEAFDNADKDFLKKVKASHPSLTPNDLRLCAYLRLNLSSKEIAPLINISVRSVEIKRYRLRKKMDLPHEQGLVEYILSI